MSRSFTVRPSDLDHRPRFRAILMLVSLLLLFACSSCGSTGDVQIAPSSGGPNALPLVRVEHLGNGTELVTIQSADLSNIVVPDGSSPAKPAVPLAPNPESSEAVRPRVASVGPWLRFLHRWSLDPNVPPSVVSFTDTDPVSAYVTDDSIAPPIGQITVPGNVGIYTYTGFWQNTSGATLLHTLELEVTGSGVTARAKANDGPFAPVPISPSTQILNIRYGMGLNRLPPGPSGNFADLGDDALERQKIGTWTVTENLDGAERVMGQFDLRMLALKNVRAVPNRFDPALPAGEVGSSTTLQADLVALPVGTTDSPDGWWPTGPMDWKVTIANSSSTVVKTLTGTASVSARNATTGKVGEISIPWRGEQDNTATPLPKGSYSFQFRALGPLGGTVNVITRPATGTVAIGDQQVTINNVLTVPDSFDPTSGGTTTLGFDISSTGLGPSPEFDWTVSVKATDTGTTLHTFGVKPGVATNNGTTLHVELPWDGKHNGTPVSRDYTWVINANATQLVAGGTPTVEVAPEVLIANASAAELQVTESATNDARATTFSPPIAALTDPLLAEVYPQNENYSILARGLTFTGNRPGAITAKLHSTVSDRSVNVTLTYDETSKAFKGSFASTNLINPQLPGTSYTFVEKIEMASNPISQFQSNVLVNTTSQATAAYPLDRRKLGHLRRELSLPDADRTVDAPILPANFHRYGFETIEVEVIHSNLTTTGLKARVKVEHPADVAVLDLHGQQTGELQMEGDYVPPTAPSSKAPRTVISLACSAYDLRDYNNFWGRLHHKNGHPESATLSQTSANVSGNITNFTARTSLGGERWFNAYQGQTVMLGYSIPAPTQLVGSVAPGYQARLKAGDSEALAWMRANREVGNSQSGLGWLCLGACAYDRNGDYYYLAFEPPQGRYAVIPPEQKAGSVKVFGIYKIPKARWSTEADDWTRVPQKVGNAELATKVE